MTSETDAKKELDRNARHYCTSCIMGLPRIVLMCAIVNIVGGLLFGYAIGFVAIYTTYNGLNTNCTNLVASDSCSTVEHASCVWNTTSCVYTDGADCSAFWSKDSCAADNACNWNERSNECHHVPEWTASQTGIFAGAMIIGGMVGSLVASKIISFLGAKKTILLCGIVCLFASILFTVAQSLDSYATLIASRFILGIGAGITCVVCPLYVGEMTPEAYAGPVGVLFQVACTMGIFLASVVGLAMQPSSNDKGEFTTNMHMQLRFQMLGLVQWLCSALFIPISFIIPTPKSELGDGDGDDCENGADEKSPMVVVQKEGVNSSSTEVELTKADLVLPLIGAIALCAAQQLTGINAVMNYAPGITKSAGLAPLTGNFIIMFWNFVTTLVSIPLSKRFPPRRLFLVGCMIASTACFLTGISVYPGIITDPTTKHVLAGVGIIIFIAAFEMGMGPTFWIHAQALFPGKYRSPGCSFTLVFQFILNILINIFFPISLVSLSGGPSGNPDKGMGIVFMIFGGFGAVSLAVMVKTLHPAVQPGQKKEVDAM